MSFRGFDKYAIHFYLLIIGVKIIVQSSNINLFRNAILLVKQYSFE